MAKLQDRWAAEGRCDKTFGQSDLEQLVQLPLHLLD